MALQTIPEMTVRAQLRDPLELYRRMYPFDMALYDNHENPVALLEIAYETALETIEAHNYGSDTEAAFRTPIQFEEKFNLLTGAEAFGYCIHVIHGYGGRKWYDRSDD